METMELEELIIYIEKRRNESYFTAKRMHDVAAHRSQSYYDGMRQAFSEVHEILCCPRFYVAKEEGEI